MAVSFVAFSSCDQNGDTTKPVINLLEPEDGDTLRIGEEPEGIHLDMELSDDVMLKSYKVEIHSNFDGHAHEVPSKSEASETVDFTFNKSWDVSGLKNTDVHHHEIIVPVNATPGKYHMMIYCTDAAGNEAHVARNIVLSTEGGEEHEHEQEEEHEHEQEH
jgi:hypothetical protein